jgi:tRNA threonylcarbamoyladenosine biosynthesis protein TsaB
MRADAMAAAVSIAIETTCRRGGLALGIGGELRDAIAFDADARHAATLVSRLAELLRRARRRPADLAELYVSVGPGSFTGTRVAATVARTLGQMLPALRLVAVDTMTAVAEGAANLDWRHLGVVLDARQGAICGRLFARGAEGARPSGPPAVIAPDELLAAAPRPLLLTGEGLGYHDLAGEGVSLAPPARWLPTPEAVWRIGRAMAARGQVVDYRRLLPVYVRRPQVTIKAPRPP